MRPALALILLALPGLAGAEVYKCKDKEGRVQYTQTRPKDGNCDVTDATPPPPTGANVEDMVRDTERIDADRRHEAMERQEAERDAAQRAARCKAARARLAMLEQSHRVFVMNDKGEREYRSDADKQRLQEDARRAVAAECE